MIAKLFLFSVEDTGAWALCAFLAPATWIGQDLRIVAEWPSTREMAQIASRVTGKVVLPIELDQNSFLEQGNTNDPIAAGLYRSKVFAVQVLSLLVLLMGSILRKVE
jgi:hypothetical protein